MTAFLMSVSFAVGLAVGLEITKRSYHRRLRAARASHLKSLTDQLNFCRKAAERLDKNKGEIIPLTTTPTSQGEIG